MQDLAEDLRPNYLLLPPLKDDRFPLNFEEILAGEQPAAYFCRTWAQMLAADAFSAVEEAGFDNPEEVRKVAMR